MTDAAPLPEQTPVSPSPVPMNADLDALIAADVPASPVEDFDALLDSLAQELESARGQREARESQRMRQAERLIEVLESGVAETEEQLRRLEPLLLEFSNLGDLGLRGHARVMRAFEDLRSHHATLVARLGNPSLQQAKARRQERVRQVQSELAVRLRPETSRDQVDATLTEILGSLDGTSLPWAEELVLSFAQDARMTGREDHLPAVARFWKQLARRLEALDSAASARARESAHQLDREIQDRDRQASTVREATELMETIKAGIGGLSHLGPEEQKAQIAIWLGRLRKLQDDHVLDERLGQEIYLTFGRVNSARKELRIDHYFDALNRNYTTNWVTYLESWEQRLDECRDADRRAEALQREAAAEQRERELQEAETRRRQGDRVLRITAVLAGMQDDAAWTTDRELQEEIRESILAGIEAGGTHGPDFVNAVRPFAPLVARGNDFRGLRRALTRIGVDFTAVTPILWPEEPRVPEELVVRIRERWRDRTVAIIGGLPREEVRAAVQQTLGLREARWYEFYRGRGDGDAADAAIRAGGIDAVVLLIRFAGHSINEFKDLCRTHGIPCRSVISGCGLAAIVRALDSE